MALLARFACGCKLRVEIPAPAVVRCADHGATARLVTLPRGSVRYQTQPLAESRQPTPTQASTDVSAQESGSGRVG
jgi:hypothetical protein